MQVKCSREQFLNKSRGVCPSSPRSVSMRGIRAVRGFTLIELLVVVLIIGILAAVAVPQYQKAVYKARATEAVLMANSLQKAVDAYILEHGWGTEFKVITDELDINVPNSSCFVNETTFEYGSGDFYAITVRGPLGGSNTCAKGLWLELDKYQGEEWTKTCNYSANTPSETFCQELVKQGWTLGIDW